MNLCSGSWAWIFPSINFKGDSSNRFFSKIGLFYFKTYCWLYLSSDYTLLNMLLSILISYLKDSNFFCESICSEVICLICGWLELIFFVRISILTICVNELVSFIRTFCSCGWVFRTWSLKVWNLNLSLLILAVIQGLAFMSLSVRLGRVGKVVVLKVG